MVPLHPLWLHRPRTALRRRKTGPFLWKKAAPVPPVQKAHPRAKAKLFRRSSLAQSRRNLMRRAVQNPPRHRPRNRLPALPSQNRLPLPLLLRHPAQPIRQLLRKPPLRSRQRHIRPAPYRLHRRMKWMHRSKSISSRWRSCAHGARITFKNILRNLTMSIFLIRRKSGASH